MTVRENLLFAGPAGPRAQREAQVKQALDDLELPGFAHADPAIRATYAYAESAAPCFHANDL